MRSSRAVLWLGLMTATLSLAAGCTLGIFGGGGRCSTAPCTYFDAHGKEYEGTCGTKKGDEKNCYCINNADKKLAQIQSGCSLQTEK